MKKLKKYLVVGVYTDNHQRWAEAYDAEDPDHAEEQAHNSVNGEGDGLIIAGVIDMSTCKVVA
jgi:hypothetical protein